MKKLDYSGLSKRKQQILKAIVDAHIAGGEPVGSNYLCTNAMISCSSATVRNEMAELEAMGYLVQPHTSAGRIPSELGYRFYVDCLVKQYRETKTEIDEINERLKYKLTEMDEVLTMASKLAASFTDYTGIAFKAGGGNARIYKFDSVYLSHKDFLLVMMFSGETVKAKPIHLTISITEKDLKRFIDALNIYIVNRVSEEINMSLIMKLESIMGSASSIVHPAVKVIYETMSELDTADVKLDGINKLLDYPEYADTNKLKSLLGVLEEKDRLLDVISSHTEDEDGINVYIGTDNDSDGMKGTSLIFRKINVGGREMAVGVIGPKRMDYSKVIDMINKLASGIDQMFASDARLLNNPNQKETDE